VCKCSIRIRGSSGFAGRDRQGGTSDESVCKLSLKFYFLLLFTVVFTMKWEEKNLREMEIEI